MTIITQIIIMILFGFDDILTRLFDSQSSIRRLICFSSIVKLRSDPLLEPTCTNYNQSDVQPTAPRPPHYKSDVHTTAPCRPLTYTCNDNNINIINSLTFLGQEVCLENKTIILKAPNNQNFLSVMKVTYFCFYDNTNLYSMRPYSSIIYHSIALILSTNNTSILQLTFFVKLINDHRHRLYHFRTWLNEN